MMKPRSSGEGKKVKRPFKFNALLPWVGGFLVFFSLVACVEWFLFEYWQERAATVANALTISHLDNKHVLTEGDSNLVEYEYSLREQTDNGETEGVMLGLARLFDDPEAKVANIVIAGRNWQLAVKPIPEPTPKFWPWLLRILGWLFAGLFSVMAVALCALNRRLGSQALYDGLTGLPSRYLFLDRLKQVIRRTKRSQGNFSLIYLKLNEFDSINENQGGKCRNMLVTGIGKRLSGFIRNCDTVTRWEGGEFLILLEDCPQDQASSVAENLCHQIELPLYSGEQKLSVSVSIGIATFPDDGYSLTALLKVAGIRT